MGIIVFVSLIQVNNLLCGASDFEGRCRHELDLDEQSIVWCERL